MEHKNDYELFCDRLEIRKSRRVTFFVMEGLFLIVVLITLLVNGWGSRGQVDRMRIETNLYTTALIFLYLLEMAVILAKNQAGAVEGVEVFRMLQYYPVELTHVFRDFTTIIWKTGAMHLAMATVLELLLFPGSWSGVLHMILGNLCIILFVWLCAYIMLEFDQKQARKEGKVERLQLTTILATTWILGFLPFLFCMGILLI